MWITKSNLISGAYDSYWSHTNGRLCDWLSGDVHLVIFLFFRMFQSTSSAGDAISKFIRSETLMDGVAIPHSPGPPFIRPDGYAELTKAINFLLAEPVIFYEVMVEILSM